MGLIALGLLIALLFLLIRPTYVVEVENEGISYKARFYTKRGAEKYIKTMTEIFEKEIEIQKDLNKIWKELHR